MCGVSLKDRKCSVDLYSLLGVQSVAEGRLRWGRLRWFGQVGPKSECRRLRWFGQVEPKSECQPVET